jgi:hypothetical protein
MEFARNHLNQLFVGAWLVLLLPASGAPEAAGHVYDGGVSQARQVGSDLYQTLDATCKKNLYSQPVQVEPMKAPLILPSEGGDATKPLRMVRVSAGFIDLLNHIAHAKAIDRIQPGYFQQYVLDLSRMAGTDTLPEMVDNRYWTADVMNDQAGYFNQMIGLTVAISLSHHYLGHYTEFSSKTLAGKLVPINDLLAPSEWDASLKAATINAMDCALATDGPQALFEAIDKMPARPAWADFIVPPATDLKKLNKQLKDYENAYFNGGLR